MSLETSNSRNLLGVRGPDGVLEALPFRAWIYQSDWRQKMVDNPPREEQIFRVEWHTLNLKRPEISETLSTMPSDARNCGTAVSCRNRVYVLGGRCSGDPCCPDKRFNQIHFHNSAFYFDGDGEWRKAPPMLFPRGSPAAVATGTKIYVFGSVSATAGHFAEVFDTEGICWETVPPPPAAPGLVPSSASHPVLLDSPRSRILVHFRSSGSLHAFYPDDGSWECLEPEFGRWSRASAMVDDVVYFIYTSDNPIAYHILVQISCVITLNSQIISHVFGLASLDFEVIYLKSASKVHGNACLESVVVMRTLDRKLHAFDVLSEYDGAKWNCYRTIAGWVNIESLKELKPSPSLAKHSSSSEASRVDVATGFTA
ncbi:hypothetical protein V6N12_063406 [Hibiscus sabdariffa]|uniref:Uncharacterized protein n=1 Tax=Hibiscus sabdariffa TaxID=183260 RepID=A0ABR2FBN4_9ROSI